MTKKNQFGLVAAIITTMIVVLSPSLAYAKSAPLAEGVATIAAQPNKNEKPKTGFVCKNKLANWIYDAGFRGENIREAWAISMRESNGNPGAVSPSGDYGLFQINYSAWGGQSWWDTSSMLTPEYNARVAYKISKGGSDWIMWGLDGHGNTAAGIYSSYGWSQWQIDNWITIPYQKYYNQYPCN